MIRSISAILTLLLAALFCTDGESPAADWIFTKDFTGFSNLNGCQLTDQGLLNDGSSDKGTWLLMPDSPIFKELDALTVVARAKALPTNKAGWFLYKTAPGGCDWGLCINTEQSKKNSDTYRIGFRISNVTKWIFVDRKKYPPENRNCFAFTVDLSGDRIPRLYINGEPAGQSDSFGLDDFFKDKDGTPIGTVDAYEFNGATLPYSGKPLMIGGANAIKKNSFEGCIAGIRLFRTALTQQEVKEICSK